MYINMYVRSAFGKLAIQGVAVWSVKCKLSKLKFTLLLRSVAQARGTLS